jgi:hypothetical protein
MGLILRTSKVTFSRLAPLRFPVLQYFLLIPVLQYFLNSTSSTPNDAPFEDHHQVLENEVQFS